MITIHHVWPGSDPFRFSDWRLSWMKYHPDASFRFWRDAHGLDKRVQQLVTDQKYTPTVKSDVLRWAVLLEEGGIYADTDMECLAPLTPFINDSRGCFLAREDDKWVCGSLIFAVPHHPFVQRMLNATLTALLAATPDDANKSPNVITGPRLITRIAMEHSREVTIHTYHRFYPTHCWNRLVPPAPIQHAVTTHHWKSRWVEMGPGWREDAWVREPVDTSVNVLLSDDQEASTPALCQCLVDK